MQRIQCPDPIQLEAYLLGLLPVEQLDEVANHVEGCRSCTDTAANRESITDPLVDCLRALPDMPRRENDPELERLLEEAQSFDVELSGDASTESRPAASDLTLPRDLDHYRLVEKLGEGGMGTVYKAVHRHLKRVVAIKVLARDRNDPAGVARFRREMEAIGVLDHANIVRATDAREADGVHFLVMEYLEGIDLSRLVERIGPLAVADVCELVRQAAVGLDHIHLHGLVHRDIKPSNLLLSSSGQLKVLDLGLTLLRPEYRSSDDGGLMCEDAATSDGRHELTLAGKTVGTACYMAPEQTTNVQSVDCRADIYSLGCTMHKLLYGVTPLPVGGRSARIQDSAIEAALARIRPDVSAELRGVLNGMLSIAPSGRTASCAEIARKLEPWCRRADLDGLLVRAGFTPTPYMQTAALRHARRASVWVPSAILVGAMLAFLGAVVATILSKQRDTSESRKITSVVLSGVAVTDASLEELSTLSNLTSLRLAGRNVDDQAVKYVAGLSHVSELNLAGTPISDTGLSSLGTLSRLRDLNLTWTCITDDGLRHLSSLQQLRYLNLSHTAISDAGVEHLKGFGNLQSLVLVRTQVSAEGLEELRRALPKTAIRM